MSERTEYPHCFHKGTDDFRELLAKDVETCCYCPLERFGQERQRVPGHGPRFGKMVPVDRQGQFCHDRYRDAENEAYQERKAKHQASQARATGGQKAA